MSGLVVLQSARPFGETLQALTDALARRSVQLFAQIDHAAAAAEAGLSLPPTTVVIFGGPAAGTPLMQAHQTLGLDLPLRALVYETDGQVFVAYREPSAILEGQGVEPASFPSVAGMTKLLSAVAGEACGHPGQGS